MLLKDADTTSGVKRLLRTNAGFVSPTPVVRRPHGRRQVRRGGDGRERRRGRARSPPTSSRAEGSDSGALRVVFRNQSLYQGHVRMSGPTVTVVDPIYARGDDVCCARHATERDYAWDASLKTFTRRATRTVTIGPTAARSRSRG